MSGLSRREFLRNLLPGNLIKHGKEETGSKLILGTLRDFPVGSEIIVVLEGMQFRVESLTEGLRVKLLGDGKYRCLFIAGNGQIVVDPSLVWPVDSVLSVLTGEVSCMSKGELS